MSGYFNLILNENIVYVLDIVQSIAALLVKAKSQHISQNHVMMLTFRNLLSCRLN